MAAQKNGGVGKRRSARRPRCDLRFELVADLRDWLVWLDAARETAVAAGQQHRLYHTITSEALTWQALAERMRAAGLVDGPQGRDAALFCAAKTLYLQVECETAFGRICMHSRLPLDVR